MRIETLNKNYTNEFAKLTGNSWLKTVLCKPLLCCTAALFAAGCVPWKSIVNRAPKITDAHLFYSHSFEPSSKPFVFIPAQQQWSFASPDSNYTHFDDFLQAMHTTAFLVIHKDSVVYERYFGNYKKSTITGSFSMAKSYVSAIVGIAISEGYIAGVNDPITKYLPYLKPELGAVRLVDLLNMRAGLDAPESNRIYMANLYYGSNTKNVVTKLTLAHEPNTRYEYQSAATQLLSMAVESATGKKYADYFREKIWDKLNMEFAGSWSSDSEKYDVAKGFCCLNSTAHDFAKFGRLYMYNGNWQGMQVVPQTWVEESLTQHYPESRDGQGYCYNYCWRVLQDQKEFFAKGILGQLTYVNKDKDVIIVRLGEETGINDWPKVFQGMLVQYE